MSEKDFYEKIETLGIEASSMVRSQVRNLKKVYTYQEIFNAIWYFYIHKGVGTDKIDKYGIGLIRDARNMEEARKYFTSLSIKRQRAKSSAIESKKVKVNTIKTKRQKQKVRREEFDWDE